MSEERAPYRTKDRSFATRRASGLAGRGLAASDRSLAGPLDSIKGRAATFALVTGGLAEGDALWAYYDAHQAAIDGYFAHVDTVAVANLALGTETGRLYKTAAMSAGLGFLAGAALVFYFGPRKK